MKESMDELIEKLNKKLAYYDEYFLGKKGPLKRDIGLTWVKSKLNKDNLNFTNGGSKGSTFELKQSTFLSLSYNKTRFELPEVVLRLDVLATDIRKLVSMSENEFIETFDEIIDAHLEYVFNNAESTMDGEIIPKNIKSKFCGEITLAIPGTKNIFLIRSSTGMSAELRVYSNGGFIPEEILDE